MVEEILEEETPEEEEEKARQEVKEAFIPETEEQKEALAGVMEAFGGDVDEIPPAKDTNGTTKADGILKSLQEQNEQLKTQLSNFLEKLKGVKRPKDPDISKLTEETMEEFGVTPELLEKRTTLMGQIESAQENIANLEAQKQAEIGNLGSMTQPHYRGHRAQIERQYNSRISAKEAEANIAAQQIQLQSGMIQDARAMTSDIINAATFDYQQEVADMEWQKDTYMDLFNIMSAEERENWNRGYQLSKDQLEQQRTEWQQKLDLQIQAYNAGIDPGWTPEYMKSHTQAELQQEIGPQVAEAAKEEEAGLDPEDYFSPEQMREINRAGINLDTPEGFQQAIQRFPADPITTKDLFWSRDAMTEEEPPVWFDGIYGKMVDMPPETSIAPHFKKQLWDQYRNQVIREGWTEPSPTAQQLLEKEGIDWRVPSQRQEALELIQKRDELLIWGE